MGTRRRIRSFGLQGVSIDAKLSNEDGGSIGVLTLSTEAGDLHLAVGINRAEAFINAMSTFLETAANPAGKTLGAQEMQDREPYVPIGVKIGMLTDDETKLGVLIIETDEGDFDFALNLEAVESLAESTQNDQP